MSEGLVTHTTGAEGAESAPFDQSLMEGTDRVFAAARGEMGAQGALRTQLFQKLLDGLPEQVALVSQDGTILAANRRWLRRQAHLKIDRLSAGDNIISYSAQLGGAGDKAALEFAQKLKEVCAGTKTECSHLYVGVGPYAGQSVKISVSRFSSFGEQLILVDARDVNDVLDLRRQRRRLGSRLLRAQEEERRRIARELHDSASQLLVGVQLNLMQLKRDMAGPDTDRLLADCATILDRIQDEFRTFAFIHHPPPLGTEGIGPAIRKLVGGFAKRTGLQVEMFVDEIRETPHGIEATLYRVAEEVLANIYRHAKATSVKLWLIGADTCVHLVISDDGIGFDGNRTKRPASLGVGIMGMKERVAEFGGHLSINKLNKGTSVAVTLPYLDGDRL